MERCLNGVIDSSVMLVINKVPNKAQLERGRKENSSFDLDRDLKRLKDEITRIFKFEFSADFKFLDEYDDVDEIENDYILEQMRNVIFLSKSYQFSNTRTWSELIKFNEDSKKINLNQTDTNEQIKKDLKDQIEKISSNIDFMKNQIKWMTRGQSATTGCSFGSDLSKSNRFKSLRPHLESCTEMLDDYKKKKQNQIRNLQNEKAKKEERLLNIQIDNSKIKEEVEKYRTEIVRLQKLLREN